MGLVRGLLAGEKCPRADGEEKRVRCVLEAREAGHLAHDARGAHARKVSPEGCVRARELGLRDHVEVSPKREEQVDLAEELHARRELASGLSRALCHGTALAAVGLEQGEDEVALAQLGSVDDDGRGMARASAGHGYSVAS